MTTLLSQLRRSGVVEPRQLEMALRRQQIYGGSLDTVLLELQLLSPAVLRDQLALATGLQPAPPELIEPGPPRPWDAVPSDLVDLGWIMPLTHQGGRILVAVHPELPDAELSRLVRSVHGVVPMVTPECCLAKLAAERVGSVMPQRYAVLAATYLHAQRAPSASQRDLAAVAEPPAPREVAPAPWLTQTVAPSPPPAAEPARASPPEFAAAVGPAPPAPTPAPAGVPDPFAGPQGPFQPGPRPEIDPRLAHPDPAELRARLEGPTEALRQASYRDTITAALLRAAAQISPRVALFGVKKEGLRGLDGHGGLERVVDAVVPLGRALEEALADETPIKEVRDIDLRIAVEQEQAIPCIFSPVRVLGRPVLVLYVDRDGAGFTDEERGLVRELSEIASARLEEVLRQMRAQGKPAAVAPGPGPAARAGTPGPARASAPPSGPPAPAGPPGPARVSAPPPDQPAPAARMPTQAPTPIAIAPGPAAPPAPAAPAPAGPAAAAPAPEPEPIQLTERIAAPPVRGATLPGVVTQRDTVIQANQPPKFAPPPKGPQKTRTLAPGGAPPPAPAVLRSPEPAHEPTVPTLTRPGAAGSEPATSRDPVEAAAAKAGAPASPHLGPDSGRLVVTPAGANPEGRTSSELGKATTLPPLVAPTQRRSSTLVGQIGSVTSGPAVSGASHAPAPSARPTAPPLVPPAGPGGPELSADTLPRMPPLTQRALREPAPTPSEAALRPAAPMLTMLATPPPPAPPPPPPSFGTAPGPTVPTTTLTGAEYIETDPEPAPARSAEPARARVALDQTEHHRELDAIERSRVQEILGRIERGEVAPSALDAFGNAGYLLLAANFPGTLEVIRGSLDTMPPPSAHGPSLRAAIALGPRFVPQLIGLFASPLPLVRFYSAFVFQELRDDRCVVPLAPLAFDVDGDVRAISMRVLETYHHSPEFPRALALLRGELASAQIGRRIQVIRALGTVRDVAAIPALIEAIGERDRPLQEAALEALCSITGQQLGLKPHRWRNWYDAHGLESRVDWIIGSLEHPEATVRAWSYDELRRITGQDLPFPVTGGRAERERAIADWRAWWASQRGAGRPGRS